VAKNYRASAFKAIERSPETRQFDEKMPECCLIAIIAPAKNLVVSGLSRLLAECAAVAPADVL
jgi:uncharacterized membrane protein